MAKSIKIFIIVLVVCAVGLAVFVFLSGKYSRSNEKSTGLSVETIPSEQTAPTLNPSDPVPNVGNLKISEEGAVEAVVISGKEVSKGAFQKIENGNIYYKNQVTNYSMAINESEVLIYCTTQNLQEANVLDYKAVNKVIPTNAGGVSSYIPAGTNIVVFAQQEEEGVYLAHTIAVSSDLCE